MVVPIAVLAPFPEHLGDWLVPGLLREKCVALIKTLPKNIRRNFAPAIDTIDRVLPKLSPSNVSLNDSLAEQLFKTRGVEVNAKMFDAEKLDNYYRMNYRVIDVDGSLVDEDRNLQRLKQRYADAVQSSVHAEYASERVNFERHNINEWNFGELGETLEYQHQGMTVLAYPMLKVNEDATISLLVSDQAKQANYYTHQAILKLAQYVLSNTNHKQTYRYLQKELLKKPNKKKASGLSALATQLSTVTLDASDKSQWRDELILAALRQSCFASGTKSIHNAKQFQQALDTGVKNWVSTALELEISLVKALQGQDKLFSIINNTVTDTFEMDETLEDIKSHLYRLFAPEFLRYTSLAELKQYPRYLRAIEARLEKVRFASKTASEESALKKYQRLFDEKIEQFELGLDFAYQSLPSLKEFATLLEEWRVSIFAQQLRTQVPVSEKRVNKAWQAIMQL